MDVRDGFVDEETDKVYQTSKSELKRLATVNPLEMAERYHQLRELLLKARHVLVPYSKMQGRSLNKSPAEEMIESIDAALKV
jgi:hypothetical protein